MAPRGPTFQSMASYLLETYTPIDPGELATVVSRIRAVAAEPRPQPLTRGPSRGHPNRAESRAARTRIKEEP